MEFKDLSDFVFVIPPSPFPGMRSTPGAPPPAAPKGILDTLCENIIHFLTKSGRMLEQISKQQDLFCKKGFPLDLLPDICPDFDSFTLTDNLQVPIVIETIFNFSPSVESLLTIECH